MKVLNFGSLNIDYVYNVDHFVKPGETISSAKLNVFCGGKGLNQSAALAKAGANVFHAGKIGKEGRMLSDRLRESGVDISYIEVTEGVSGHAIIQVDSAGQNCIILHGGANTEIDEKYVDTVLSHFQSGDILLLQNEISSMPYIINKAHEKGMKIAFNPSPISKALLSYPLEKINWFILNEIEGNELTNKTKPEEIAGELMKKYPGCAVVLTLGKKGVYYKDENTIATHGIYDVKVVDTTAAGDTFTGFFLAGAISGLDINETLRRASVASSLAVSKMGASTSIPSLDEVMASKIQLIK